jgi:hypothetical protein
MELLLPAVTAFRCVADQKAVVGTCGVYLCLDSNIPLVIAASGACCSNCAGRCGLVVPVNAVLRQGGADGFEVRPFVTGSVQTEVADWTTHCGTSGSEPDQGRKLSFPWDLTFRIASVPNCSDALFWSIQVSAFAKTVIRPPELRRHRPAGTEVVKRFQQEG